MTPARDARLPELLRELADNEHGKQFADMSEDMRRQRLRDFADRIESGLAQPAPSQKAKHPRSFSAEELGRLTYARFSASGVTVNTQEFLRSSAGKELLEGIGSLPMRPAPLQSATNVPLYTHPPSDVGEGFVVVPVEPTEAMRRPFGFMDVRGFDACYRAMLTAAPGGEVE